VTVRQGLVSAPAIRRFVIVGAIVVTDSTIRIIGPKN
jgi:hypothetical protein